MWRISCGSSIHRFPGWVADTGEVMQTTDHDMMPPSNSIQCAACQASFFWDQIYWQSRTPGSKDPAGNDYISRVFCPHCGAIVCEGIGAGSWAWVGDNQPINRDKAFPPTLPPDLEWIPDDERGERFMEAFHDAFGKRQLPRALWVPASQQRLDLSSLGTFVEIPFGRRKTPLHTVLLARLGEFFARLTGKQNEPRYPKQTMRQPGRSKASYLSGRKSSLEREVFYHEDDYCMIEVLPMGNWDTCISRLRFVGKYSDAHSTEIGWTSITIRGDNPQPLESLNIKVKDLVSSLSQFLGSFDRVLTGYSTFREVSEDTLAFGSVDSYIIFVDFNPLKGTVEDLWLDFGTDIHANRDHILKGLQVLGSLGELLLVDWDLGQVIDLSDQDAVMAYLELQEKRRARGEQQ